MRNIFNIDKNFAVKTNIEKDDIKFYNINAAPFSIYGITLENGRYRRMPEKVAQSVSEGVSCLHANTSGGRVRFVTDSGYVAISAQICGPGNRPHFALTGSSGFDLHCDNSYVKTFIPSCDMEEGYESVIELGEKKLRNLTINFPLYSDVLKMYIGVSNDAVLKEAPPYVSSKPVVYYGSSITQGACASRPGRCYQNIISRRFNCDYINLGFSGSAKAEDEMAEYIKKLDMSIFVYDYDYNAPTVEHLKNTHEKMFKVIRSENPSLPIIVLSRPKVKLSEKEIERRNIIEATYKNALDAGDENVYFIGGETLMELCGDEGTVDGIHPTDFGFASMAKVLGDVIEKNNLL